MESTALHVQPEKNDLLNTFGEPSVFARKFLLLDLSHTSEKRQIQDNTLFVKASPETAARLLSEEQGFDAVFVDPSCAEEKSALASRTTAVSGEIPVFIYTRKYEPRHTRTAIAFGADDYLFGQLNAAMVKRIEFFKRLKSYKSQRQHADTKVPQIHLWALKRTFDVFVSASALMMLSPLLALIAAAIKLESKGPVFYISKRAGSGYKIFDFYKFRSMRVGADKELNKLSHMNQYAGDGVFFKIKDDPRITRLGQFLRNTSLDEIPQLYNVLIGDMSLVGNRPLPLYEAEKLTKDQIAWRFLAPAGITGLWQITKRGKDNMSEDERIALDIEYAMKNSFWLDVKIMFATIPALLQKAKV